VSDTCLKKSLSWVCFQELKLYRMYQNRVNRPLLSETPSNNGSLRLSGVMSQYVSTYKHTHIYKVKLSPGEYRPTFLCLVGRGGPAARPARFTPPPPPPYPLDMRLGRPQSRSGRHGEVNILVPSGTRNPTLWSPSL
jgi:hypothetical protein